MVPPSITIRIDFGADNSAGTGQALSVTGGLPTPLPFGTSPPAIASQGATAATPPTPFDHGGQQSVGQAAAQTSSDAPAPSPDFIPGHAAGSDDRVPTPFDSPDAGRVADQQPAAPYPDALPGTNRTAAAVPRPDSPVRKRDRK